MTQARPSQTHGAWSNSGKMALGAFAPLPIRLGGSATEGWTAEQHARLCADLLAVKRTAPVLVMRVHLNATDTTGEIEWYASQTGTTPVLDSVSNLKGAGYRANFSVPVSTALEGEDDRQPMIFRSATVTANHATPEDGYSVVVGGNELRVYFPGDIDADVTIVVYGEALGRSTGIGDYGGSLNKGNDTSENPVPYAAQAYRDIQQQRGSAYTTKPNTLVDAENIALARWAAYMHRLPERLKNNLSGPRRSDEGLEYWSKSQGINRRSLESRADLRARCVIHAKPARGATYNNLTEDVSALLGDAFVGITRNHDGSLETPPVNTYWPTVNPGDPSYDLGGGAWYSTRSQVIVNAQQPAGMSDADFKQLMNVELFDLLDRMVPAWVTVKWKLPDDLAAVWDGGRTWDDGTLWDSLFDWNS